MGKIFPIGPLGKMSRDAAYGSGRSDGADRVGAPPPPPSPGCSAFSSELHLSRPALGSRGSGLGASSWGRPRRAPGSHSGPVLLLLCCPLLTRDPGHCSPHADG